MKHQSQFSALLAAVEKSPTEQLVANLLGHRVGSGNFVEPLVAQASVSMEGYAAAQADGINEAIQKFKQDITAAFKGVSFGKDEKTGQAIKGSLSVAQEQAAVSAGMISTAGKSYQTSKRYSENSLARFASETANEKTITIGHASLNGAMDGRVPAMEAYDERDNKNVVGYSVAYNLQASRQGEFGEAFYPTVIVAPDQVGYNVNIRLLYVYNEVARSASGALNPFNRRNLIRAIIDSTILAADQTRIIPVYRSGGSTDSTANFVPGITPTTTTVDGQPLTTAPLAIGANFSILGISQTNAQLAAGTADQTDAVDSSVILKMLYLKVTATVGSTPTTEYIPIDVSTFPTANFNVSPQGNTRKLQLNFDNKDIFLSAVANTVAGVPSTTLPVIFTGGNTARLHLVVSGSIVQDLGDTTTMSAPVTVALGNTAAGTQLDLTTGAGLALATAVTADITVVGYDLTAYKTNSDRRARGILVDVQHVNFLYTVPLLPPITALRPVTASDTSDGNLLSDLVTTTRVQTANRAVTALLAAQTFLAQQASASDVTTNLPVLFGASSDLVAPAYVTQTLNVATSIDSISDERRASDLQTLLINKIRDMAILLWVQSGYGPAAESMYEGQPPKPVVIIGTDPYIARYLQLVGDTRVMGDMFDYVIVQSYDLRMQGQLLFSFGQKDSFNSGVPNPLHFGNMAWRPEMTLMMPMVRNAAQSMELTVQPSYRHVNNLPIMGQLIVQNITAVMGGKVAINNHPV